MQQFEDLSEQEYVFQAFDVEATGQIIGGKRSAEVVAISIVTMRGGVVLSTIKRCFQFKGYTNTNLEELKQSFDKDAWDYFWFKQDPNTKMRPNMIMLSRYIKEAQPPEIAMLDLENYLRSTETLYGDKLIRISDFSSFDISWVNYYLGLYGKYGMPIHMHHRVNDKGEIRFTCLDILDTFSVFVGGGLALKGKIFLNSPHEVVEATAEVKNNHCSTMDALTMCLRMSSYVDKNKHKQNRFENAACV